MLARSYASIVAVPFSNQIHTHSKSGRKTLNYRQWGGWNEYSMNKSPKRPRDMTVDDAIFELAALNEQGLGGHILYFQVGNNEHEDLPLQRVRVFKFAGKNKVFLVF